MSDASAAETAPVVGSDEVEKMRADMAFLKARAEKAEKKNETWDSMQRQEIATLREDVDGFVR